jgi:2-methylcitrate dehydratase PrpD
MGPTQTLAHFVTTTHADDLPDWLLHEAKRTLINALAVSLSASRHPSSHTLVDWVRSEGAAPRAGVIGSDLRTSPTLAALINGFLCHLDDYDDTHFPTVLHPSAPVWPAVLAASEEQQRSGRDTLAAFVVGGEVACRVSMSVHPWHYDQGWHITGTMGVLGAAAGAGHALGLDAAQMRMAFGIAGTQAAGVREVFGSDSKALHPGKAASNGFQAAALARTGFTSAEEILAGRRGVWAVLSPDGHNEEALTAGLGDTWELRNNGLKPYANGVVSHPIQDAVIQLRTEHELRPEQVANIEARVHPLVLELMNRPDPQRGLEGKFSFQHCAAAALVDGAGHPAQFTDAKALDATIAAVRARVTATADASLEEDQTEVTIALEDGRQLTTRVEHATGSPTNPLTDAVLEAKYRALAVPVLGEARAEQLLDAAWHIDGAATIDELMALARA